MLARVALLSGFLFTALLPVGAALADAPAPTRAPRASLVDVLRGGAQALVFDRMTGDYAVVKLGDSLQGLKVVEIEGDQIVLAAPGVPERFFVLPLVEKAPGAAATPGPIPSPGPIPGPTPVPSPTPVPGLTPTVTPATPAPTPVPAPAITSDMLDPYAVAMAPSAASPADPVLDPYDVYGESQVITEVQAPDTTPPAPVAEAPAVVVEATPVAPPVETPTKDDQRTLSRKELDQALSSFASISKEVQIALAEGGGVRITHLARGSFVARIGFESGDVIRSVAGHSIDTVDDAAAAYAAVLRSKQVVVELERKGARTTVRYQMVD
jgi:hypothetical protein